jgi:hypothetical protein
MRVLLPFPDGLDYDNARYYDPVVRLLISADSEQSNQQGMNPCVYMSGNPETDTDDWEFCFVRNLLVESSECTSLLCRIEQWRILSRLSTTTRLSSQTSVQGQA